MPHSSSLFRELPLLYLIFDLDIWFQNGHFTMNSQYPKLGDGHFKKHPIACMCSTEEAACSRIFQLEHDVIQGKFFKSPLEQAPMQNPENK